MLPWLAFLFVGVLDMGFYLYAAIALENATRLAATQTSMAASTAADSVMACNAVLADMKSLPNLRNVTACGAAPLVVTAAAVTGIDGAQASRVTVAYQTMAMLPIPGLTGRLAMTRVAEMRVKPQ